MLYRSCERVTEISALAPLALGLARKRRLALVAGQLEVPSDRAPGKKSCVGAVGSMEF